MKGPADIAYEVNVLISEKENYLRCYRGERPEWVPRYGYMTNQIDKEGRLKASDGKRYPGCINVRPSFLHQYRTPDGGGRDIWGVPYLPSESMGGTALPTPGKYLIRDFEDWQSAIKTPDISGIDWEAMAAHDMANIDREQTAVRIALHSGYFQALVDMAGYISGLSAFYTNPEEVKALMKRLSDFYCAFAEKVMEYYKPDIYGEADDLATAQRPFISPEIYREFIKPWTKREIDVARKAGCYIDLHCCGKAEAFLEDWLEMGIHSWNPAQVSNDLPAVKKKYGDRLVLIGCWDSQGPAGWLETGEEETKAAVRRCVDSFADNGRFIFWASTYGRPDDQRFLDKTRWIAEEFERYGRNYYGEGKEPA